MTNTWIAICDDVIGFYGIPTNTIKSFFEKRKELLRNVILSEIRQGDFSRVNEDDMIAICFRLLRDAMEGVAKNNLRLSVVKREFHKSFFFTLAVSLYLCFMHSHEI